MTYRFRPPWWAWLLVTVLAVAMLRLGFWQLDRADEKQRLIEDFAAAERAAPAPMPHPAPEASDAPQHLSVTGEYLAEPQFLLDSQVRDGRPGVHVWTPLRRKGGGIVLVDRGWIPDPGRDAVPALPVEAGTRRLSGLWRALPRSGYRLHNPVCDDARQPGTIARVIYPVAGELQCRFDEPLADGVLLLREDAAGETAPVGLRDWQPRHLDPSVHHGYALQWFSFTTALLVIFLVMNLKKR